MANFFLYATISAFIFVCLFLILLVLIQKGRGGGLSGAFGGAGGNTAFGSKTGDVLTWATSVVFGIFLLLAIVLNLLANGRQSSSARAKLTIPPPNVPTLPTGPNPIGADGTRVPPPQAADGDARAVPSATPAQPAAAPVVPQSAGPTTR